MDPSPDGPAVGERKGQLAGEEKEGLAKCDLDMGLALGLLMSSQLGSGVLLFFLFSWLYLQPMEGPGPGVELELQLPAYTTATAMLDPSHICYLRQIPNSGSEARDETHILMETTLGP